jgi:hypothetical protein
MKRTGAILTVLTMIFMLLFGTTLGIHAGRVHRHRAGQQWAC